MFPSAQSSTAPDHLEQTLFIDFNLAPLQGSHHEFRPIRWPEIPSAVLQLMHTTIQQIYRKFHQDRVSTNPEFNSTHSWWYNIIKVTTWYPIAVSFSTYDNYWISDDGKRKKRSWNSKMPRVGASTGWIFPQTGVANDILMEIKRVKIRQTNN